MSIFYDQQESTDNAMACAQIEADQRELEATLFDAVMVSADVGDTSLFTLQSLFTLHTKAQNVNSLHGFRSVRHRENSQFAQLQSG